MMSHCGTVHEGQHEPIPVRGSDKWLVASIDLLGVRNVGCSIVGLALLYKQRLGDFANESLRIEHIGVGESDAIDC